MKYHLKERAKKYAEFAKEVFGIVKGSNESSVQAGIDALVAWFKKIGVPTSFAQAGMPTDEFDAMADDVLLTAKNWGMQSYDKAMVLQMLELCK